MNQTISHQHIKGHGPQHAEVQCTSKSSCRKDSIIPPEVPKVYYSGSYMLVPLSFFSILIGDMCNNHHADLPPLDQPQLPSASDHPRMSIIGCVTMSATLQQSGRVVVNHQIGSN